MKVAIFAELTVQQFNYLRNLAQENNIEVNFVVEGDETPTIVNHPQTATPITGEVLSAVATALNMSAVEIAVKVHELRVTSIEETLAHSSVPSEIKRILEGYL